MRSIDHGRAVEELRKKISVMVTPPAMALYEKPEGGGENPEPAAILAESHFVIEAVLKKSYLKSYTRIKVRTTYRTCPSHEGLVR